MIIGYVKESDYMKKALPEQHEMVRKMTETQPPTTPSNTVGEVMEISYKKLPPMPEKSAFMFLHNFYPKLKVDLKDAEISQETRQKLLVLQHDYDDIVSKHSTDIRITHLEEMKIDTYPNLPPVASKPYPLLLKHHKFVKEEINNLIEAGLIKRSVSPYATPIIVLPIKDKPGAPLAETKRLAIDYHELNIQITKVKTTQTKLSSYLGKIKRCKIFLYT